MTKKFVGLVAILVCHATVALPKNAIAASASQTKSQMPAAHPMPVTPPAPKTNIAQPGQDHKVFLLNPKMNSQGVVKGKSTRETSTSISGATVITTKIHPSSFTNKVDPSAIDQVGAPLHNASSKDAAQMSVLKAFPPYSFDKFSNASAASVTQSGEAGGAGKIVLNSFSTRKSYPPPVWAPGSDASKESTIFVYGGLSLSPNGSAVASVLRVDGARIENISGSNTITISSARTETAGGSTQITPGAARTEKVSGSTTATVSDAGTETAGGSTQITPGAARTEKVSGSTTVTVSGAETETASGSNQITPAAARAEKVGGSTTVTVSGAGTETASGSDQITPGATRAENVSGSNTVTVSGARDDNGGSSTGNSGQAKNLSESSSLNSRMGMDEGNPNQPVVIGGVYNAGANPKGLPAKSNRERAPQH